MGFHWQTLAKKAKGLPLGHYAHKEAQAAASAEYDACHEQAKALRKKHNIRLREFKPQEAFDFCLEICKALGSRPIKQIVLRSKEVSEFAFAHCGRGEIHFKYSNVWLDTLFHELTHHLGAGSHGKNFCEIQELVYEAAMQIDRNKLQMKEPSIF
jgi:hypothetical protein